MVRGILLAIVGVALVVVSWGPLHNLFSQYRDSSLGVYVVARVSSPPSPRTLPSSGPRGTSGTPRQAARATSVIVSPSS